MKCHIENIVESHMKNGKGNSLYSHVDERDIIFISAGVPTLVHFVAGNGPNLLLTAGGVQVVFTRDNTEIVHVNSNKNDSV